MNKYGKITIRDVSERANASIATTSRVLNNTDYPVKPEMRKRILKAAKELGYTPNLLGKALKTGKSHEIGVVVPSLLNPYYAEAVTGIERICSARGYNPVFCSSDNSPDKELANVEFLIRMRMDGIIISKIEYGDEVIDRVNQAGISTVYFDQPVSNEKLSCVTYDFFEAGRMAAEYLTSKGHKKIAFFSLPFDRQSRISRYEGFKHGLKEAEGYLYLDSSSSYESGEFLREFEAGERLVSDFLEKSEASAVVAINDLIAIGAMNAFSKRGVSIPNDISVVGLDDISFATMSNPALTTVKQPSYEMGSIAAEVLIDGLEGKRHKPEIIKMLPKLVERDSVCMHV